MAPELRSQDYQEKEPTTIATNESNNTTTTPKKRAKSEEASQTEKGKRVKTEEKEKEEGISGPGELPPSSFGQVDGERKHGELERGHIYFVYRPKVEKTEAHSLDEISRLQILLLPSPSSEDTDKKNYRLLVVGRKRIPKTGTSHEVLWGKVIATENDLSTLREKLGAKSYDTKTLGERHLAPARIAARGHYILTSPASNLESVPKNSKNFSAIFKTYLAYKISVPNELGEVQHEMRIENDGCFGLQVKNPDSHSTNPVVRDPKDSEKPAFPSALSSLFTTKFIPANPPSLLSFPGVEILMLGSTHPVEENIGKEELGELKKEVEEEQKELSEGVSEEEEEDEEAVKEHVAKKALEELGMQEEGVVEALEGHWA